ncbi:MAG: glycoside hydrolase family 1 protein [Candidatus Omnitrophica bacterium]|nr:glycoside hydrolase family 1 protein [Candidatus Omnitrophota bacterium]
MAKFILFPKNFLWGAATSAYQVEGGNINNDWYFWGNEKKTPSRCAKAVDSYNRFEEDFDLAGQLGHNAQRISLEWSRIEPQENQFNQEEIEHYRKVLLSLKARGIKAVLTLHHFTNPLWFYSDGCWLNPRSVSRFAEYVNRVSKEFYGLADYWITINEPLVYVYNSYLRGAWPPGEKSISKVLAVIANMARAHLSAYKIIHNNCQNVSVSIAKHIRIFSPCQGLGLGLNALSAYLRNQVFNYRLLEFLAKKKSLDFIGVNYYGRDFVKFSSKDFFGRDCYCSRHQLRRNSLGWYVFPEGLLKILMRLKKFNLPLMITENGTSEKEDYLYEKYLRQHLFYLARALGQGVDIIGYLWWSLIDNFEWDKGFGAKFGLIGVDRDLNRSIKPFALAYKDICLNNKLEYA